MYRLIYEKRDDKNVYIKIKSFGYFYINFFYLFLRLFIFNLNFKLNNSFTFNFVEFYQIRIIFFLRNNIV